MEDTAIRKRSAPYGQACVNCVRAKCRCTTRDGSTCERCHRLDKECIPSATGRKKTAKSIGPLRKSKLEVKLDDLVSLLRTQNVVPATASAASPSLPTPQSDHSLRGITLEPAADVLTDEDLSEFREHHIPYFPFMHLSRSTTAEQLQLEKPVLSLAIHTICTKAISRQSRLSKHVRETLASRIVVEGERSMDLLLGLIACMAWSPYVTHGKQFLGTMACLARSMISDLRLDRPASCPSVVPCVENKREHTIEGSRALLAVFGLSTIISTTFKYDLMSWSSHIEEACDKLTRHKEVEADDILVTMARVARITLNAAKVARQAFEDAGFAAHVARTIGPLSASLDNFRGTLTPAQLQDSTIITFIHNAEITIYELSLLQPITPTPAYQYPIDHNRISYLTACLHVCKGCTDYFLAADITCLIAPSMLVYTYSIKILYKLSTLQHDPCWDPALVKATIDIAGCVAQAAASAERGNAKLKAETGEDSILAAAAETMRSMAPSWRVPAPDVAVGDVAAGWSGPNDLDVSMVDFSNDFWLSGTFNF